MNKSVFENMGEMFEQMNDTFENMFGGRKAKAKGEEMFTYESRTEPLTSMKKLGNFWFDTRDVEVVEHRDIDQQDPSKGSFCVRFRSGHSVVVQSTTAEIEAFFRVAKK